MRVYLCISFCVCMYVCHLQTALEHFKKHVGSFFTEFAAASVPLAAGELKLFIAKFLVRQTSFALREVEMQILRETGQRSVFHLNAKDESTALTSLKSFLCAYPSDFKVLAVILMLNLTLALTHKTNLILSA